METELKLLALFILVCTLVLSVAQVESGNQQSKMINKLFLVQVDATAAASTTRWRPKYEHESLPTFTNFLDDLDDHLFEMGLVNIDQENERRISVEAYDPIKSIFIAVTSDHELHDYLTSNRQAIQILVKNVHGRGSLPAEVPLIRGRAFDTSQGLSISSTMRTSEATRLDQMKGDKTLFITEPGEAHLGTGLNTWDGSIVLAKYLELHQNHLVHGKDVLEVGAGTGIAGMATAWLGARYTVLTDLPYVLDNLQSNIVRNFHSDGHAVRIEAKSLDWMDTSTYPIYNEEKWDVIIGADVVWIESLIPSLVQALTSCANENTTVLISHQVSVRKLSNICCSFLTQTRSKHSDELLYKFLGQHFDYAIVS